MPSILTLDNSPKTADPERQCQGGAEDKSAINCKSAEIGAPVPSVSVGDLIHHAFSDNTRRAYRANLDHFAA
jgi:hypothetical protein